jgi:manganese/zinc/iron transport system permease protein
MNPYQGVDFIGFFVVFFERLWGFLTGAIPLHQLANDEVQLVVLSAIAVSSALVGTFLVLRKMSMLANSLSHTILVGIVIAFMLTTTGAGAHALGQMDFTILFIAAIVTGIGTSLLTEFLTKTARLQEDASTGIVFTTLFALGIIIVTVATKNAHIGTEVVMGNVDALQLSDCSLALGILLFNVLLTVVLFKEYVLTTFDPGLARTLGFSVAGFNYLLMIQVSATIIGAFRAVGVLMVLAFITGPTLTARLLSDRLLPILGLSMGIGVFASVLGVALSRHILSVYDTPLTTAGLVVILLGVLFIAAAVYKKGLEWRQRQAFSRK